MSRDRILAFIIVDQLPEIVDLNALLSIPSAEPRLPGAFNAGLADQGTRFIFITRLRPPLQGILIPDGPLAHVSQNMGGGAADAVIADRVHLQIDPF